MRLRWNHGPNLILSSFFLVLAASACTSAESVSSATTSTTRVATASSATATATTQVPATTSAGTVPPSTIADTPPTATDEPVITHHLAVASEPTGVVGELLTGDRAVSIIVTPWAGRVPAGEVMLEFQAPGYDTKHVMLDVSADTSEMVHLDKEGQLVSTITVFDVGGAPKQVAFTPDNSEIWVTLLDGDGVEVYEPFTGELIAEIDLVGRGAVEVIFNRAGSLAYVSQMETSSVYEVDVASKAVLRNMPAIGAWTKVMVLSPDERTLYASNWVDDNITEFDLDTGEVVRILPTVNTPRGLYITPDGDELWVTGFLRGEIQVIDLASGRGSVIYRSGGSMRHLVGDAERGLVYASDMTRANVLVIDVETREVAELAKVDRTANTIDLSPDGRVLYVSSRGRNHADSYHRVGPDWGSVAIIDTATGRHLDTIVGGNQPTGLDVSPDGRFLAHSDFLDNRVTIYQIPVYDVYAQGGGGRYEAHFAEIRK